MMQVINPVAITATQIRTTKAADTSSVWNRYMAYAEAQEKLKVFWFMKLIIMVPCVLMVLSITVMAALTTSYLWFVALSMLMFFTNVIVHIAELESRVYVPLYHATVALFIAIPLIAYVVL